MTYSEIQQQRRRAEKLINRAMHHARAGQHALCASLMDQANNVLTLIVTGINKDEKYVG